MKNASYVWQLACQQELGVDSNGDTVSKVTNFGAIAIAEGLDTSSYGVGYGTKPEIMQKNPNTYGARIKKRADVVAFLRAWADSLEDGE
jgi:hypothetical protein